MALHRGGSEKDHVVAGDEKEYGRLALNPFFGEADPVGSMASAPPRHRLPDRPLPPDTAYQLVHDELMLDGNARLNLATFVTTWMEPQAGVLMAECRDKNMIDKDEYPQHRRAGAAVRGHARRPVARARPGRRGGLLDHRVE